MNSKYLSLPGGKIKGLYALQSDIICHFSKGLWENAEISLLLKVQLVGKMQSSVKNEVYSCYQKSTALPHLHCNCALRTHQKYG